MEEAAVQNPMFFDTLLGLFMADILPCVEGYITGKVLLYGMNVGDIQAHFPHNLIRQLLRVFYI